MKQKALIIAGICLLLAAGSAIYLRRNSPEHGSFSEKGSALAATDDGKGDQGGTAEEGSFSAQSLQKRSRGQDSELVKRFGESRVKLAKNTAGNLVSQMESMARIMEFVQQDRGAIDTSRVESSLRELYQKLDVNDSQRASLDALAAKQMEDDFDQIRQAPARVQKGHDLIVEAMLTGDAVVRGKISPAEYEPLIASLDKELDLQLENGTAAGLLNLKGEWEKFLDERQLPLFEQGLQELKKQADEENAAAGAPGRNLDMRSPNILLSKPRSLDELSDEIYRQKKMMDGLSQVFDVMKGK